MSSHFGSDLQFLYPDLVTRYSQSIAGAKTICRYSTNRIFLYKTARRDGTYIIFVILYLFSLYVRLVYLAIIYLSDESHTCDRGSLSE